MYINKITLALLVIYVIINAYLVINIHSRLEAEEVKLEAVREQSTACTMLLLAHVDLHGLEKQQKGINRYNNYDDLLPLFPKKKYD